MQVVDNWKFNEEASHLSWALNTNQILNICEILPPTWEHGNGLCQWTNKLALQASVCLGILFIGI